MNHNNFKEVIIKAIQIEWLFLFNYKSKKKRYIFMQVFKPSDEIHILIFIPRKGTDYVLLKIRNELRDIENEIEVDGEMINGVFNGNFEYTFKEGGTYEIEVFNIESNLLFRGKAFATDVEDLQNYKLIR